MHPDRHHSLFGCVYLARWRCGRSAGLGRSLTSLGVSLAASTWFGLLLGSFPAHAAPAVDPLFPITDRQPTPAELQGMPAVASAAKAAALLKEVRFPEDFETTIFATPPAVNYPVYVAATADGVLYISSDGNGSLDRKPHLGRVLRVRDTDGDGDGDEVRAFVPDVDSPRGLVWDGDRLYLLHPPHVSAFIDKDGDGVAEAQKVLIRNIAFTFKDRPADHSSNGLELGIDGWLYAAIGDFGFMEAEGTDGRKLQLRAGGVVRFRPDGTGLELYARGTRNILEVAMSPRLDGFARDNTNDGGGWDVRFHHFGGMSEHGYPSLFRNFADEIVVPLADYGGGSGCGAAWVGEPLIPAKWNGAAYTADWGRDRVYRHRVTPKGATFTEEVLEFCTAPRATDLDVDAHGTVYVTSWKGASFTWVGPEVGFVVAARPKGAQRAPLPDFASAPREVLVRSLESASHRVRLEAQRALLRRGLVPGSVRDLRRMAADARVALDARIAAVYALKQGLGAEANRMLVRLSDDVSIAPWTIRALGDRFDQGAGVDADTLSMGLRAADARTRKEAAIALARLNLRTEAPRLAAIAGDPDPVVAHTTVQALIQLQAADACFAVLDIKSASPTTRAGVLRALQSMHDEKVVAQFIRRLAAETDGSRRTGLLTALCRLYFQEGEWEGDSWGTRPDTRGPYYQPEPWSATARIDAELQRILATAAPAEVAHLGREMARHRIPAAGAMERLIAQAAGDPSLLPAIAAQLSQADSVPAAAIPLLATLAQSPETAEAARAQAVLALQRTAAPEAWRAIIAGMARVAASRSENNLAERARSGYFSANLLDQVQPVLEQEAARIAGDGSVWADAAQLRLASRRVGAPEAREAAAQALDAGWASGAPRRTQIIRAAMLANDSSQAQRIADATADPDPAVAAAAREAVGRLRIDVARLNAAAKLPRVGDMDVAAVLKALPGENGDVGRGRQLFTEAGCNACHTVRPEEALKGPYLGTIAATYGRQELAEAILTPNKTLAQGFVAHFFELKDGTEIEGFVVQEAADAVTIRTVAAAEQRIPVSQIVRREKREKSLMPEGLAATMTVRDLASLLDYLRSLTPDAQKK